MQWPTTLDGRLTLEEEDLPVNDDVWVAMLDTSNEGFSLLHDHEYLAPAQQHSANDCDLLTQQQQQQEGHDATAHDAITHDTNRHTMTTGRRVSPSPPANSTPTDQHPMHEHGQEQEQDRPTLMMPLPHRHHLHQSQIPFNGKEREEEMSSMAAPAGLTSPMAAAAAHLGRLQHIHCDFNPAAAAPGGTTTQDDQWNTNRTTQKTHLQQQQLEWPRESSSNTEDEEEAVSPLLSGGGAGSGGDNSSTHTAAAAAAAAGEEEAPALEAPPPVQTRIRPSRAAAIAAHFMQKQCNKEEQAAGQTTSTNTTITTTATSSNSNSSCEDTGATAITTHVAGGKKNKKKMSAEERRRAIRERNKVSSATYRARRKAKLDQLAHLPKLEASLRDTKQQLQQEQRRVLQLQQETEKLKLELKNMETKHRATTEQLLLTASARKRQRITRQPFFRCQDRGGMQEWGGDGGDGVAGCTSFLADDGTGDMPPVMLHQQYDGSDSGKGVGAYDATHNDLMMAASPQARKAVGSFFFFGIMLCLAFCGPLLGISMDGNSSRSGMGADMGRKEPPASVHLRPGGGRVLLQHVEETSISTQMLAALLAGDTSIAADDIISEQDSNETQALLLSLLDDDEASATLTWASKLVLRVARHVDVASSLAANKGSKKCVSDGGTDNAAAVKEAGVCGFAREREEFGSRAAR